MPSCERSLRTRLLRQWHLLGRYRWTLLCVACAFFAGALWGTLSGGSQWPPETSHGELLATGTLQDRTRTALDALPGWARWLRFFVPNSCNILLSFLWAVVSFGVYPLWVAWHSGVSVARTAVASAVLARHVSDVGPVGSLLGVYFPHGVVEYPVFLFSLAISLRAGLSWIVPLRGIRRGHSVRRVARDFLQAFPLIVLLLLAAASLEEYANPYFAGRYLVGIGRYPKMHGEHRVGRLFRYSQSAWSPRGDQLATTDYQSMLWILSASSGNPTSVVSAGVSASFSSPSWSPDGETLVVTRRRAGTESRSFERTPVLLSVASGRLRTIANQPSGECLYASWSPTGAEIACAFVTPDIHDRLPAQKSLWTVQPDSGRWKLIADFPRGAGPARGGSISWRPDGKSLAFVMLRNREAPRGADLADCYSLCTISRDGRCLRELLPLTHTTALAWSPDSKWIALTEPLPGLLTADPIPQVGPLPPALARICFISADGVKRVDDFARADATTSLSWSPDGRFLAYQRLGTCLIGSPVLPKGR